MILVHFFVYIIFVFNCIIKYKNIKSILLSCEFIFETTFIAYTIPAAICFLLDNNVARISMFNIDYYSILKTLILYFNVNAIFLSFLLLSKNDIKSYNQFDYGSKCNASISKKITKFNIFDIISIALSLYFIYLNFKGGLITSNISYYTKRNLLSMGNLYDYIYIYMIAYCYSYIYIYLNLKDEKKKITHKLLFIMIISILFWGVSLFTGRRYFFFLLMLIFFCVFSKLKKIQFKHLLLLFSIIVILLLMSFFRMHLKKYDYKDIFYFTFGEFINVNYVSNYYVKYDYDLKYGKTYIINTITSFVPNEIYKNKPNTLAQDFMKITKSNYGLAFNPIAEGLLNFGSKYIYLFLPLIFILYIKSAYILQRKFDYAYFIVTAEITNFMRGQFSTSFFLIFFMVFICYFIIDFNKKKDVVLNVNKKTHQEQ